MNKELTDRIEQEIKNVPGVTGIEKYAFQGRFVHFDVEFDGEIKRKLLSEIKLPKRCVLLMGKDKNKNAVTVCVKNMRRKRTEVPEKIYHVSSSKNRNSILDGGLKVQEFDFKRWDMLYFYKPALFFCTNSVESVFVVKEATCDIWEVDTKGLNTEWFRDCNMMKEKQFIMCFSDIPKENIRLVPSQVL